MIRIINSKIFNCKSNCRYHWSKLKIREIMKTTSLFFKKIKFINAILDCADFSHSVFNRVLFCKTTLSGVLFKYVEFKNCKFNKSKLLSSDLSYSNISECEFLDSNLMFASFRGANLFDVKFKNSILADCDFRYARIENCDFSDCILGEIDFRFSKLKNVKIPDINGQEVFVFDYICFYPVGDKNKQLIVFNSNLGLIIQYGSYYGTIDSFLNKENVEFDYILKLTKYKFKKEEK